MVAKLSWTPLARSDLLRLYVDIGSEQPAAAERFFLRIEERALLLTTQPRMGARRWDITPDLRMLVEAPFVLLYRITPDVDGVPVEAVDIIRVVDGRRDLLSLF
jgi:toxin ParE1/3/4